MSRTDHPRRRTVHTLPSFPISTPRDRLLHAISQSSPKLRECIMYAGVEWLPRKRVVRVVIEIDADRYIERFS